MEDKDIQLIQQYIQSDLKLKTLFDEHQRLDKKISKLKKRTYLTAEEQREEKKLQKLKLAGKDKIMLILETYQKSAQV